MWRDAPTELRAADIILNRYRRSKLNAQVNVRSISNSQIIFEALKKNNVKTDFITIAGADHGFRGEDAKCAMAATVSWFEQTLVKNGKP